MGKLRELLIEPFLVLITLLAWLICVIMLGSVVGGVVPLVGALLIFALPRWRSNQPFITLELLMRNESAPEDSVASRGDRTNFPQVRPFKLRLQVGVGRLKPAPPSSRGGPTGAAG